MDWWIADWGVGIGIGSLCSPFTLLRSPFGTLAPPVADAVALVQEVRVLIDVEGADGCGHPLYRWAPPGSVFPVSFLYRTPPPEPPGRLSAARRLPRALYRRLDAARDRDRGGVGLGLYLCRQICQAHGGTIGVTSVPGEGSTFWLTLPLAEGR